MQQTQEDWLKTHSITVVPAKTTKSSVDKKAYLREYRQQPENKERAREAIRALRATPEGRAKHNESSRKSTAKAMLDPVNRAKHKAANARLRAIPEYREYNNNLSRVAGAKRRETAEGQHKYNMACIKHKYSLTEDEFQSLMFDQKGLCKICGKDFGELPERASIDHCHSTGKVRGLLCRTCNTKVGYIENLDPEKTIRYLRKLQAPVVYSQKAAKEYKHGQGCECELCGRTENPRVDHDHVTGYIRGILCGKCNVAISAVESSGFVKYAKYLQETNAF